MIELVFAGVAVALAIASLVVALVVVHKTNQNMQVFLKEAAIDERNQRMHEVRSLLQRLQSQPSLRLEAAAPEIPQIDDPQPFISDFEMDDDQYEAYVQSLYPTVDEGPGPTPAVEDE